jgi:serine/threonine-protein kinase RsbW
MHAKRIGRLITARSEQRLAGVFVVSRDLGEGSLAWRSAGGRVADVENKVEFRVAARLENLAILRTLVAAVSTFEDLDSDTVSDLRLAVDEACTRLIRSALPDSILILAVCPKDDELVIDASTTCTTADIMEPGSFSWHVLSSLTDEVSAHSDGQGPNGGQVVGISMTTRRVRSLR